MMRLSQPMVGVFVLMAVSLRAENPEILSTISTQGGATSLAIWGNTVGVVEGSLIEFVDVSKPADPRLQGHFAPLPSELATDIAISDGIAYISFSTQDASSFHGVRAIDINDPTSPVEKGRFQDPSAFGPISVAAIDRAVYTLGEDRGPNLPTRLFSVDFSNLESPRLVDSSPSSPYAFHGIELAGERRVFIFHYQRLYVFTRSDSGSLDPLGVYGGDFADTGGITSVASNPAGTRVYIGFHNNDPLIPSGIQRVAFEPKGKYPQVQFLSATYTEVPVNTVAVSPRNGAVFAGMANGELRVFDHTLTDELARVSIPGIPQDFAVRGQLLFVASGSGGVTILRFRVGT